MGRVRDYVVEVARSPFFVAYLLVMLFRFIGGMFNFFLPLHLQASGFSGFEIGLFFATAALTSLLFEFGIGIFTDRVPIKRVVAAGFVCIALYLVGFSITASLIFMLVVFFFRGLGYSLFEMSMDSFTLKHAEGNGGRRFGIYRAVTAIPDALGILLGGAFLFILDFSLSMKIAAGITLLALLGIRHIPEVHKKPHELMAYLGDFRSRRVIFFALAILLFTMHWGVEFVAYSLFLKHNLGLNLLQIGLFIGIPIIFLGLSGMLFGKLYDGGMTSTQILVIGFLVSGGGFVAMALSTNPFVAFAFRILHEMGDGAFSIFMLGGAKKFFNKERIGGDYGLIRLIMVVGTLSGALIYSPIGARSGYEVPHIIAGALIIIAGCAILAYHTHVRNLPLTAMRRRGNGAPKR